MNVFAVASDSCFVSASVRSTDSAGLSRVDPQLGTRRRSATSSPPTRPLFPNTARGVEKLYIEDLRYYADHRTHACAGLPAVLAACPRALPPPLCTSGPQRPRRFRHDPLRLGATRGAHPARRSRRAAHGSSTAWAVSALAAGLGGHWASAAAETPADRVGECSRSKSSKATPPPASPRWDACRPLWKSYSTSSQKK